MVSQKKRIALLLVMVMALAAVLSACADSGLKITQRTSDDVAQYGSRVVAVIDEYLNFDKTQDEYLGVVAEIYDRMEKLDIDDDNSEYNESDKIVYRQIERISEYGDHRSDADITLWRDIIAFHIGVTPIKETHTPDLRIDDDNQDFVNLLGLDKMPTALAYEYDGRGSVTLDAMYGANLSDLYDVVSDFSDKYGASGGKSLFVWYYQYDSAILSVDIFDCASLAGTVTVLDSYYYIRFTGANEMKDAINDAVGMID